MLRQCVLTPAVRRCSLRKSLQLSYHQLRLLSYRAVIFDMYGVLLPSPIALATEFEQQHGVPIGTVGRAIRAGGRDGIWQRFMRGELGVQEFTDTFTLFCSERAGCPVPIGSLYSALTSGQMRQPVPLMLEALHRIRQRGLKTALLTNNFLQPDGQPFLPLDPTLFDVVVQSVIEGISKPDKQIFEVCLSRLGVASQHTVFLDDLTFNVQAAAHLGITAIQVKEPVEAIEQLEEQLGFPLRPPTPKTPQRSQGSRPPASQPTTEKLSDSRPRGEKQTDSQPIANKLTNCQPIRPQQATSQPVPEQLADYLRTQLHLNISDTVSMQPIRPWLHLLPSGGHQQQHFLVRTQQQGIMGTSTLDTELGVLEVLRGSGVPVPDMVHYCQDPRVLGGPFLLMELCGDGRALADPALLSHTPSERKAVYEAVIETLCCIHRHTHSLNTHQLNLPVLSVGQQVELWIRRYQALQNRSQPIRALQNSSQPITALEMSSQPITAMERLCTWLPLHLPSQQTQTLLHGDYSCSNVWLHAGSSEVVCVLDWSHAATGDPLLDLSTFISSLPGSGGQGFTSPDQLIGQYCEWMEQELRADWRFYMSLQLFRQAVLEQEEVAAEFQAQKQTKGAEQRADRRVEHCDWLLERMGVVERQAELAWDFATQEGFRLFKH